MSDGTKKPNGSRRKRGNRLYQLVITNHYKCVNTGGIKNLWNRLSMAKEFPAGFNAMEPLSDSVLRVTFLDTNSRIYLREPWDGLLVWANQVNAGIWHRTKLPTTEPGPTVLSATHPANPAPAEEIGTG